MCAEAGRLVSPRPTRRIMPLSALFPPPVAGPSAARNGFLAPSFKLRSPRGLNPLDDPYRRQALSLGLCSNSLEEREGPHRSSLLPPLESQLLYLQLVAHSFAPLKSATSFISASYALFHENYRGGGTRMMIPLEKADPSKGKALPDPGNSDRPWRLFASHLGASDPVVILELRRRRGICANRPSWPYFVLHLPLWASRGDT